MNRIIASSIFVCLVGCAETPKDPRVPSVGMCSIAEMAWPAAPRDFDRARTLEAVGSLENIAKADRTRYNTGSRADVGGQLDELYRQPASTAFVSHGVAELAVRLRQLDCAVQRGRFNDGKADALYAQILAELEAEQHTLDGGGAGRSAAP
jgi:hypothetical protein